MKINLRDFIIGKIREGFASIKCRCMDDTINYEIHMNVFTFYFFETMMTNGIKYYSTDNDKFEVVATFEGHKVVVDEELSNYEIELVKEKEN